MQAVPQAQQQVQQMMGAVQQPQPQGLQAQGAPHQMESLPMDAAETLYVDNMTMDVNRREMAHVFRPFEGFKVPPCLLNVKNLAALLSSCAQ